MTVTGPADPKRYYIYGLSERISRDRLERHLEEILEDCDIEDVMYGIDPSVALVTFKTKPGGYIHVVLNLCGIYCGRKGWLSWRW